MRKGCGPPSMVPPSYPSYYEHLMDQYWARQGTYENPSQQEYLNTEKYRLCDNMQYEAYDNEISKDAEIKTDFLASPVASRLER